MLLIPYFIITTSILLFVHDSLTNAVKVKENIYCIYIYYYTQNILHVCLEMVKLFMQIFRSIDTIHNYAINKF